MHADGEVIFELSADPLRPIRGRDDFDHQIRCGPEITRFSGLCLNCSVDTKAMSAARSPVWSTLYEYANLANQYLA